MQSPNGPSDDGNKNKLILFAALGVLALGLGVCCVAGIVYSIVSSDDEPVATIEMPVPTGPTPTPVVPQRGNALVDAQGHATPQSFGVETPHSVEHLVSNVVGMQTRMVNATLERAIITAATSHFSRRQSRTYFAAGILSTDWRISRSRVGIIRNRNLDVLLFWRDEGGVCRAAPYAFKQDSDGRGFQSTFRYADGRSYEVAHPVPTRGERPSNPQKTRRRNDYRLSSRDPAIYAECSAPGAIERYVAERMEKQKARQARRRR